ncbi:MAG TPA: phenylacetate--CoA ligase family protein, partial [Candidatus Binatia bacterium]|nr:phenylacetate--CoA ligase family protein [Candidatus Binatia bacterium]
MENFKSRAPLEAALFAKWRALLGAVLPSNKFYQRKFAGLDLNKIASPETWRTLPFTTKSELVEDQQQHPPWGSNLTFPEERYVRIHQTSGTTGKPLYWLDTEESWEWWAQCWKTIYRAAGVRAADRIYFAFSFGP